MSTSDTVGQYNYDFGYGSDSTQGQGEVSSGNLTAGFDTTSLFSNNNFLNQLGRALLGTQGASGTGAGLALGLGALAAALTRQQAPAVKQPEYKAAPVYNRALTAPMFPPQPAPQKSASGQNIYTPMKGMPLFFNPNPFQFDATEAAKRYGPTQEQIAQGQAGYEAGLASLYKPMTVAPIVTKAEGGEIDDIMVGYNEGGDVYAAAGRYLEGPGDGMSDSITAQIDHGGGKTQPARLARGEFVVPADVVSDLGNGSSNAGAQKLYDMMKKIRKARHGTSKQPPAVKTDKAMPA
jgi:hypothetical protein